MTTPTTSHPDETPPSVDARNPAVKCSGSTSTPSNSPPQQVGEEEGELSDKDKAEMRTIVTQTPVVVLMKGTPSVPRCGFSGRMVSLLIEHDIHFSTFDILSNEDLRAKFKRYASWPTYPMMFADGELIGGIDVVTELAKSGEIFDILRQKAPSSVSRDGFPTTCDNSTRNGHCLLKIRLSAGHIVHANLPSNTTIRDTYRHIFQHLAREEPLLANWNFVLTIPRPYQVLGRAQVESHFNVSIKDIGMCPVGVLVASSTEDNLRDVVFGPTSRPLLMSHTLFARPRSLFPFGLFSLTVASFLGLPFVRTLTRLFRRVFHR